MDKEISLLIIRLRHPSDNGECDLSCLEDWIFRTSQVSLYLEMLVSEGLNVSLSGRVAPTLLPPCRETHWNELSCLLDIPTLMFLAPQVSMSTHTSYASLVRVVHVYDLLLPLVARRCWRSLETSVFNESSWGKLHQDDGWLVEPRANSAHHQRHKGPCFWGLCFPRLGDQTTVPG